MLFFLVGLLTVHDRQFREMCTEGNGTCQHCLTTNWLAGDRFVECRRVSCNLGESNILMVVNQFCTKDAQKVLSGGEGKQQIVVGSCGPLGRLPVYISVPDHRLPPAIQHCCR